MITKKKHYTITDGCYYFMDCLNAVVSGYLLKASEFKDDAEAVQMAANYEATLYKCEYKGGIRMNTEVIYVPT